jgi:hypothetical protein
LLAWINAPAPNRGPGSDSQLGILAGSCLELFSRKTAFVFFGSRKPKGSLMLMLVFFLFFGPPSRMPGKEEFIIQLSYFVACSSPLLFAA